MSEKSTKPILLKPLERLPADFRECLLAGRLLNGETISAYLQLIERRSVLCSEYPTVWAVDTFFYSSLAKRGSTAVRRALLDRDPLASDLIFIPVHEPEFGQDGHWYLLVVDFKLSEISAYDSIRNRNHRTSLYKIKDFMDEQHQKATLATKSWYLRDDRNCAIQTNAIDCGVFVCAHAEALSRSQETKSLTFKPIEFRRRMNKELSDGSMLAPAMFNEEAASTSGAAEDPSSLEEVMRQVSFLTQPLPTLISPIRSPVQPEEKMAMQTEEPVTEEMDVVFLGEFPAETVQSAACSGPSQEEEIPESPSLSLSPAWSLFNELAMVSEGRDTSAGETATLTNDRVTPADAALSSIQKKARRGKKRYTMKIQIPGTNQVKRVNVRKLGFKPTARR